MTKLLKLCEQRIQEWLTGAYDTDTKEQLRILLKTNPAAAQEAFQSELVFGTGGVRAPVGIGTARFNVYTVRMLTQGLANYLLEKQQTQQPQNDVLSVMIGYDCRVDSLKFAEVAAEVLLGNGIEVHLCEALRPTPLVSFGCRLLKCSAGIMITASHNPPKDNGYKVYSPYGGQIAPPEDQILMHVMRQVTSLKQVKQVAVSAPHAPHLHRVGTQLDEAYLAYCEKMALNPTLSQKEGAKLCIIYSNLHGTGGTLIPSLLKRSGFSCVTQVASQADPDGAFPTVVTANPEDPAAMSRGMQCLREEEADLFVATDPDADRVGVAVREGILTGNQVACLCLDFICRTLQQQKRLPKQAFSMKTVVTTPLFSAISTHYGVPCIDCLPGSKYMSQYIEKMEKSEQQKNKKTFLFGAEESCGYLFGAESREKDAVLGTLLIAEAALDAKKMGMTLYQKLHQLYAQYGIHREAVHSWRFSATQEGQREREEVMHRLRKNPPLAVAGRPILACRDFFNHSPSSERSNLIFFQLENAWFAVRPSGTEPKIKLYVGIKKPANKLNNLNQQAVEQSILDKPGILEADTELQELLQAILKLFTR